MDPTMELIMTILAALAQEEARSMSENIRWKNRTMRMEGKPPLGKTPYGYKSIRNEMLINEKQAKNVKFIFDRACAGWQYNEIIEELNKRDQSQRWRREHIRRILFNTVYLGDYETNKYVSIDYMDSWHKNRGRYESFYIEDHHEPIVSREVFAKARIAYEKKWLDGRYKKESREGA